ncbi:MAG: hypothetical protein CL504_01370 [Actinobacteria bacterium]|nr:hypothetical protein [Actinomycetota bacterium]
MSGQVFPKAVVHDRGVLYGHWLADILLEFECQSIKTPPRYPWHNSFVERFNLSIKTEILNRIILIEVDHVRVVCLSYQRFYNTMRPHQGLSGRIPCATKSDGINSIDLKNIEVFKSIEMGGLVTQFRLAA